MKTHELKILPQYFEVVQSKDKCFEIQKDDRDFAVGDKLILKEYEKNGKRGGKYTGRTCERFVQYIHHGTGEFGLAEGYCVLGLSEDANDKYRPT